MNRVELIGMFEEARRKFVAIGFTEVMTNVYRVDFNTRAKKIFGQCSKSSEGRFVITINKLYADLDPKGAERTMIHEIAHSLKGCMNHGDSWKRVITKINRVYGYNIETGTRMRNTNEAYQKACNDRAMEYRHAVKCPCGQIIRRQKMSKLIEYPHKFRCSKCHGLFERVK